MEYSPSGALGPWGALRGDGMEKQHKFKLSALLLFSVAMSTSGCNFFSHFVEDLPHRNPLDVSEVVMKVYVKEEPEVFVEIDMGEHYLGEDGTFSVFENEHLVIEINPAYEIWTLRIGCAQCLAWEGVKFTQEDGTTIVFPAKVLPLEACRLYRIELEIGECVTTFLFSGVNECRVRR